MRLDIYLAEHGLCRSRSEAQRLIKNGRVSVSGRICTQCARDTCDTEDVSVDTSDCRYVSRGGLKLQAALDAFGVQVAGCVAVDVGASTGGFTDCLLHHGARLVYALENGSDQLDRSLRGRSDVVSIEHANARYMTKDMFGNPITLATMDVSFISQTLILPALAAVLEERGTLISLIKPQFEVGRAHVGKGGIVRDAAVRQRAAEEVCAFAGKLGFRLKGMMESPIKGGDGNTEYIAYFVLQKGKDK